MRAVTEKGAIITALRVDALVGWCLAKYAVIHSLGQASAAGSAHLQLRSQRHFEVFHDFGSAEKSACTGSLREAFGGLRERNDSLFAELAAATLEALSSSWDADERAGTIRTAAGLTAAAAVRVWLSCDTLLRSAWLQGRSRLPFIKLQERLLHHVRRLLQSMDGKDMAALVQSIASLVDSLPESSNAGEPLIDRLPSADLQRVARKIPLLMASDMDNFSPADVMDCVPLLCRLGVMPRSSLDTMLTQCRTSLAAIEFLRDRAESTSISHHAKKSDYAAETSRLPESLQSRWCPAQWDDFGEEKQVVSLQQVASLLESALPMSLIAPIKEDDI